MSNICITISSYYSIKSWIIIALACIVLVLHSA